jgi:hypothetical protein
MYVCVTAAAGQDRVCSYEHNLPYTFPATDLEVPFGVVPYCYCEVFTRRIHNVIQFVQPVPRGPVAARGN